LPHGFVALQVIFTSDAPFGFSVGSLRLTAPEDLSRALVSEQMR